SDVGDEGRLVEEPQNEWRVLEYERPDREAGGGAERRSHPLSIARHAVPSKAVPPLSDCRHPPHLSGFPSPSGVAMSSRRAFVQSLAGMGAALPMFRPDAIRRAVRATGRLDGAPDDERYWGEIQRAFDTDRTMINLNNGGVCPTPTHVLEQMIGDLRFSNELPVHHMWAVLEPRIESVRRELALDFGWDPEEMALPRKASEGVGTLILRRGLKPSAEGVGA